MEITIEAVIVKNAGCWLLPRLPKIGLATYVTLALFQEFSLPMPVKTWN
jgi:hypothetical protein